MTSRLTGVVAGSLIGGWVATLGLAIPIWILFSLVAVWSCSLFVIRVPSEEVEQHSDGESGIK